MRRKWGFRNGDLLVDGGQVGCPTWQVNVDYERCQACPMLRTTFEVEGIRYVRCSRPIAMEMAAFGLPDCL